MIGKCGQSVAKISRFVRRQDALVMAVEILIETAIKAGLGHRKFHFVMEFGVIGQTVQPGIHQTVGNLITDAGGQEGVEAVSHIDIGTSADHTHQFFVRHGAVSHTLPRPAPHIAGHQLPIEGGRERSGYDADHFRRVPIRHDAQNGPFTAQSGAGQ